MKTLFTIEDFKKYLNQWTGNISVDFICNEMTNESVNKIIAPEFPIVGEGEE